MLYARSNCGQITQWSRYDNQLESFQYLVQHMQARGSAIINGNFGNMYPNITSLDEQFSRQIGIVVLILKYFKWPMWLKITERSHWNRTKYISTALRKNQSIYILLNDASSIVI